MNFDQIIAVETFDSKYIPPCKCMYIYGLNEHRENVPFIKQVIFVFSGVVLAFVLAEVWGRIVPEVAIVDVAINCRRLCQAIACRQSSLKLPICLLAAYVCFICLGFFFTSSSSSWI